MEMALRSQESVAPQPGTIGAQLSRTVPEAEVLYLSGTISDQDFVWPLIQAPIEIGRCAERGIAIPHPTVSKRHAVLVRVGNEWAIRDLRSRNGIRVNGIRVRETVSLRPGDRVSLGEITLRLTRGDTRQEARLSDSDDFTTSLRIPVEELLYRGGPSGRSDGNVLDLLGEVGRLLVLPRPIKEICDEILRIVERAVPASRLMLLLVEKVGARPVQISARYRGGSATAPLILSQAILDSVLTECTSVITTDAMADPRFQDRPSIVSQGTHSAMAVPLFDNESVLGLLYLDQCDLTLPYVKEQLQILTLFANMAAVKITNVRLLEAEADRARMKHELAVAARVQRSLLPHAPVAIEGFEFEALLEPCYEVGGDLYDIRSGTDGSVCFLLGDVSGKGMGAALLMSSVLASARVLYDRCSDLGEFATRLSDTLEQHTRPNDFVTAFVGHFDPATRMLRYVNAGHPAPFLVGDGTLRSLPAAGIPLGALPGFEYRTETVELKDDELFALFTDGIPEAMVGEEFFGEGRLAQALAEGKEGRSLRDLSRRVIDRLDEYLAGAARQDDVALLLLRSARGGSPTQRNGGCDETDGAS